jgi:hypothetical protein
MSDIKSVALHITPGQKFQVDLTTRNAGGHDTGPAAVIADGGCYKTEFLGDWNPDGGGQFPVHVIGTGGTPPVYANPDDTDPISGGPNPGYHLNDEDGMAAIGVGSTNWKKTLGFAWKGNTFGVKGLIRLKGRYTLPDGSVLETPTAEVKV